MGYTGIVDDNVHVAPGDTDPFGPGVYTGFIGHIQYLAVSRYIFS
jgi:hypothetical protein